MPPGHQGWMTPASPMPAVYLNGVLGHSHNSWHQLSSKIQQWQLLLLVHQVNCIR